MVCFPIKKEKLSFLACLVLLAGVYLAYAPSLHYAFVWDDFPLIVENEHLQENASWISVFTRKFLERGPNVDDPTRNFYRPLVTLSYRVDHDVWGLNPKGFHLTNLILHALCVLCVFGIASFFFKRLIISFLVSLLFGLHPTHVENVCWISGRTDLFCGFFFLLAFYLFLGWGAGEGKKRGVLVSISLFYFCALLCKEMAISFPFLVVLYLFCFKRGQAFQGKGFFLFLLALMTGGYLGLRFLAMGYLAGEPIFGSLWERFFSIPMVFTKYLGLLLLMVPIDVHHAESFITTFFSWQNGFYLWVGFTYFCLAFFFFKRARLLFYFLIWIPLTLLPVFRLGAFGDILFADRFLYLPSVGFVFLLAYGISLWVEKKEKTRQVGGWGVPFLLSLLCLCYFFALRESAKVWQNGVTLFGAAVKTSPESAYIHFRYGLALSRQNRHVEAIEHYQKANSLLPNYLIPYINAGISFKRLGKFNAALASFRKAIAKSPNPRHHMNHLAYYNMGNTYTKIGDLRRAQISYQLSLEIYPTAEAYRQLGECFLEAGFKELALENFEKGLKLKPLPQNRKNQGAL